MKKVLRAESFVGIVIGVFILSFILLGIGNIMFHSRDVITSYRNAQKIDILKNNISHIVQAINTDAIRENEIFYVYKNDISKNFEVFTGTIHADYKYIDEYGNNVDINTFQDNIYARILWKERDDRSLDSENQIIRVSIKKLIKK